MVKFIKKKIGLQKSGKRRLDLNNVVCGILYYLKTGCTWRFLPSIFGSYKTIAGWFSRLAKIKVFEGLWVYLMKFSAEKNILNLKHLLGDGGLVLTTSNMPIKSKNPRVKSKNCINRLMLTDKNGLSIAFLLQKGTANDTRFILPLLDQVMQHLQLPKNFMVHADKGFDSLENRVGISKRDGIAQIPVRNMGFETEYPKQKDKYRYAVERSFAWLNSFKALKIVALKKPEYLFEAHCVGFINIFMRNFTFKNSKIVIGSI